VTTVGITVYDLPPAELVPLAVAADRAGFDAIWLGEHIVLPVSYEAAHPTNGVDTDAHHIAGPIVDVDTELLDPFVALGAAAGATTHLRLATGIFILPLRHPLAVARAACTLQDISGGRFLFGIGAGWLEEEFAALDMPFTERGARYNEAIELLRAAWAGGAIEHHGPHFDVTGVQVTPRPTHVPLVIGGNTPRAMKRSALVGDAWFSSGTPSFDEARRLRDDLHAIRDEHGRTEEFRCYVRVEGCDPGAIEAYTEAGLTDVVVWADKIWHGGSLDDKRESLAKAGELLGLTPR